MADLLTAEKLRLFLIFMVPGIVILYVRRQFVVNRRLALAEAVPNYVAISIFYQAVAWPLTLLLVGDDRRLVVHSVVWIVDLLLLPALVGFVLGLNARQGWFRQWLVRLGVNIGHPVDTAWDWKFGGCEECWVLAVLKDGTRWAGHLGGGSFMSTEPAERDIYIENVYAIDEANVWTRRESSVWISQGELQSIEFWPLKRES